MTVLENPVTWRSLVRKYSDVRDLRDGMTAQRRGQHFNQMIADLFTAFGITAKANQNSIGELDVVFTHAGRRFILEAKWEHRKTATGPIAKLQRRVEQRMVGVTGVFLSMNGYSEHAIAEIDRGRRLDILLLDQEHWLAMLSGLVPPPELLDLATDAASFTGSAYTSLTALLDSKAAVPDVDFGASDEAENTLFRSATEQVQAEVAASGIEARQPGIAVQGRGALLVTADHGVLSVDLATRSVHWAVPVSGCSSSMPLPDGSVLIHRAHGVGCYRDGVLTPVSSASSTSGGGQLLSHPDTSVWCLDARPGDGDRSPPVILTKLGPRVGDELVTEIPGSHSDVTSAAWLTTGVLAMAVNAELQTITSAGDTQLRMSLPAGPIAAVQAVDDHQVLVLASDATLWICDVATARYAPLGQLTNVDSSARLVLGDQRTAYLSARYIGHGRMSQGAILQVRATAPWMPALAVRNHTVTEANAASNATQSASATNADHLDQVPVPARTASESTRPSPELARSSSRAAADERLADQRRGNRDGASLTATLPLEALEGAIPVDFDVARWLEPWREGWKLIATGQAPAGTTSAQWLPAVAQMLGSYAAPAEVIDSYFTPSPAYVIGFSKGMRATWEAAVRQQVVPHDGALLREWLWQPVDRRLRLAGRLRREVTLKELRAAFVKARVRNTWAWTGRVTLWFVATVLGLGVMAAVGVTLSNGWPLNSVGGVIFSNLVYDVPFVGALAAVVYDLRRMRKNARGDTTPSADTPANHRRTG